MLSLRPQLQEVQEIILRRQLQEVQEIILRRQLQDMEDVQVAPTTPLPPGFPTDRVRRRW